jgi:hypothetical protein
MGTLPTPRDYAGVHHVDAVCVPCDHWGKLDLVDLIGRGQGDVPLIRLPLRCSRCGKTGHRIVVTGRSYMTRWEAPTGQPAPVVEQSSFADPGGGTGGNYPQAEVIHSGKVQVLLIS